MAITALPTPPSRSDPANFADRGDAFLGALPTFVTEANALATATNQNEINAELAEVNAEAAQTAAEAAAAAAVATANVTLWVSGTTYAIGANVYSPIDFKTYRRKTSGAGTTDPSADSTNWALIASGGDVTLTTAQTLTNKTISYADNTLTGVVGITAAQTLTNKTLTSPVVNTPTLTGSKETRAASSANNLDLATANYFTHTVSGATTFTVSNVASTGSVNTIILDLTNGGSAAITWWSGMKWAAGTAPTLTTAGRDVLGFFTHDGGTTWSGLVLAKDIK